MRAATWLRETPDTYPVSDLLSAGDCVGHVGVLGLAGLPALALRVQLVQRRKLNQLLPLIFLTTTKAHLLRSLQDVFKPRFKKLMSGSDLARTNKEKGAPTYTICS